MSALRDIRLQAAIVRDHHVLLIQHREHAGRAYWLLPGGGREPHETDVEGVAREVLEETGLTVRVERLILDEPEEQPGTYQRRRTYVCSVLHGEAAPGHEPEEEAQAVYGIAAVAWLDLRSSAAWPALASRSTPGQLERLRRALGYITG